mmetsp:Transcript_11878/g.19694  ORF Transcript_11878/g.19694 Transcript_11878/m.19694 type:complete len:313 (+) Transcript_11878:212-1150(+)
MCRDKKASDVVKAQSNSKINIDLCAVSTAYNWHILNARAHWNIIRWCKSVLDVSTSVHMVIQGHKEQVIEAETVGRVILRLSPSNSMTMDISFSIVRVCRTFGRTQVGVVGRVCVVAVCVTSSAITIIIARLAIATKAAHHCLILTVVEFLNCGIHNGSLSFIVTECIYVCTDLEGLLRDCVFSLRVSTVVTQSEVAGLGVEEGPPFEVFGDEISFQIRLLEVGSIDILKLSGFNRTPYPTAHLIDVLVSLTEVCSTCEYHKFLVCIVRTFSVNVFSDSCHDTLSVAVHNCNAGQRSARWDSHVRRIRRRGR